MSIVKVKSKLNKFLELNAITISILYQNFIQFNDNNEISTYIQIYTRVFKQMNIYIDNATEKFY